MQVWGGVFYLLAKVFLAYAEGKKNSLWRVRGWLVYLLGVPPWVIILWQKHNWIAMGVEAGGAPAMLLALYSAVKQLEQNPSRAESFVKIFVRVLVIVGVAYSMYDFGGITSLSQILELGVTAGYLIGTYLLAKKDRRGWLCFILMNLSMGILMVRQEKWILVLLQTASIFFAVSGFRRAQNAVSNKHTTLAP